MIKIDKKKLEKIRKINKNIIHDNGEIESFDKQLIDLISGDFDITKPLVIQTSAKEMDYIEIVDTDYPIIMNVSTFIKLQNKHNVPLNLISNMIDILKDSVLAFESMTEKESVIVLTNRKHMMSNDPYIISCRYEKKVGLIQVNEITSFYDKQKFENFIINTYQSNKKFFKNKKTEQYFSLNRLQLPQDLTIALSNSYDKASFNKSQVEQDLGIVMEGVKKMNKKEMMKQVESFELSGVGVEVLNKEGKREYYFYENLESDGIDRAMKELYPLQEKGIVQSITIHDGTEEKNLRRNICKRLEKLINVSAYDDEFKSNLLARMKQDCDYFLGYGNRLEKHLWAGNVEEQIQVMKDLYRSIAPSERPNWISLEEIESYKYKMENEKEVVESSDKKDERISLNSDKERLLKALNDFYLREYDYEEKNELEPVEYLAYTTTSDEKSEIQIQLLVERKVIQELIDDEFYQETQYNTMDEIIDTIDNTDFNSLVSDALYEAEERIKQKENEKCLER